MLIAFSARFSKRGVGRQKTTRYSTGRKEVVPRGREPELSGLLPASPAAAAPAPGAAYPAYAQQSKARWTTPFPVCGFVGELWVGRHGLPLPVCCREAYSPRGLGGVVYIAEMWYSSPLYLLFSIKSRLKYLMGGQFTSFRLYFPLLLQAPCSGSAECGNGSGEATCPAGLCIGVFR